MRDAIHALKYQGVRTAAKELGKRLALALAALAAEAPSEMLVVPVPLHRARYRTRGFNQTRLLAAQAVEELAFSHREWKLTLAPKALLRIRATATQAGLTPRQRRLNLRKAFAVENSSIVAGRDILLVDDILTTGATARAASRTLIDAGARSVWVATLARARRNFNTNSSDLDSSGSMQETSTGAERAPQSLTAAQRMDTTEHQRSF